MNYFDRRSATILLVGFIVLLHLSTLPFPLVNQEFAFASAVEFFRIDDFRFLDIYFSYQANTLGVPLFAHAVTKALPFVEPFAAARFSAILGLPLLAWACWIIGMRLGLAVSSVAAVILLVLTNPLIWIYSQRGTADFLPVSIGMLGFALMVSRDSFGKAIAALMIGLASVLKPHALVFLWMSATWIAMASTGHWRRRALSIGCFTILALLPLAAYLYYAHAQFGFWLFPPRFAELHQLTGGNWWRNFLAYTTYVVLLVLPFSALLTFDAVASLQVARRWMVGLGILVLAAVGAMIPGVAGEMNFGPLDRFLPAQVLALLAGFGVVAFGVIVGQSLRLRGRDESSKLAVAMASGIVLVVVVLSFSRPAQRYLLFVLPLLYLLFPMLKGGFLPRWALVMTLLTHIALCGYATAYQWVVGKAAYEMASKIDEAGLLAVSIPGPIEHHVGDRFFGRDPAMARFAVVVGRHEGALIVAEASVWRLVGRTYSLVPLPGT